MITSNKKQVISYKDVIFPPRYFTITASSLTNTLEEDLAERFEALMSKTIAGAYSSQRMRCKTLLGSHPFIHRSLCVLFWPVPLRLTTCGDSSLEGRLLKYF